MLTEGENILITVGTLFLPFIMMIISGLVGPDLYKKLYFGGIGLLIILTVIYCWVYESIKSGECQDKFSYVGVMLVVGTIMFAVFGGCGLVVED